MSDTSKRLTCADINCMSQAELIDTKEFNMLKDFFDTEGSANAVPLSDMLTSFGISAEVVGAMAERLNAFGCDIKGSVESGYYKPDIYDYAKENVLDKRVMNYVRTLSSIEEIQGFQSEILEFALKQKRKTEFTSFIKSSVSECKKRQKEFEQAELMEKFKARRAEKESSLPYWAYLDNKDRPRIDERKYMDYFVEENGEVRCWNGKLRTLEGLLEDEKAMSIIQGDISQVINYRVADNSSSILRALKNRCYCQEPKPNKNTIHFPNGTLTKDNNGLFTVFSEKKEFCLNRLATNYNPNAPEPTMFLKYMNDLYTPEQIVLIKQFLGYCLIPTNALNLTLHIYGKAESGKSRLGFIMQKVLGKQNSTIDKISKLGERFGGANVEGKLLYIDDDVTESALTNTQMYKSIITTGDGIEMEFEAKYKQTNKFIPYARFLSFGNFTIHSLHDHTQGFYRRIIVLECKPPQLDRKNIPSLDEVIYKKEGECVLKWCIEGLNELIENGFKLPLSDEIINRSNKLKYENDSVKQFLQEDEHIIMKSNAQIHTVDLYKGYESYCNDNGLKPISQQSFTRDFREHTDNMGIEYSTNIIIGNKRARGFKGIAYFS